MLLTDAQQAATLSVVVRPKSGHRDGPTRSDHRARCEPAGSGWVRSVSRVTTPKVPPPPPLSAQNRSGLLAALAVRTAPSGVTTSASSRFAAAVPGLRRPGAQTVVELRGPHVGPGPDERRIRRVRARDITVTAALHHQADTVLAGEVHRGRDIGAAFGEHCVR